MEKVTERLASLPETLPSDEEGGQGDTRRGDRRAELERAEKALTHALINSGLSQSAFQESLAEINRERETLTVEENQEYLRAAEQRQLASLIDTWHDASPLEKGAVIAQVADFFLVERVGRTGAILQPGRVSARWHDQANVLVRLGPEPVPADESGENVEERRAEMARERYRRYRERKRARLQAERDARTDSG